MEKNLARIATPWNPDTPIETVFANGTNCRKFAVEGNDPISDAAHVRILVKIFTNSGVLDRAVSDWERKPDAEQTVLNAIAHFRKENTHRLEATLALKRVLEANSTNIPTGSIATKQGPVYQATLNSRWKYCCLCTHSSQHCRNPGEGHNHSATLDNRQGGSNTIRELRPPQNAGHNITARANPQSEEAANIKHE
jgi:hypothetical protein